MAEHPDLMNITLAQTAALHRVYNRDRLYAHADGMPTTLPAHGQQRYMTFEEFIMLAQPTIGMDGAITVPWCGMWLAIERNGHVHS